MASECVLTLNDTQATPAIVLAFLARSLALSSQPVGEAFARSLALIGQSPIGYVAASGPGIGESVFPGEALARSLALTGQDAVDDVVANEP